MITKNDLSEVMDMCDLTYDEPTSIHGGSFSFRLSNEDYFFILEKEDKIYIGFRGTDIDDNLNKSKLRKFFERWRTNFKVNTNKMFHPGFYGIFQSFWPYIEKALNKDNLKKTIVIFGHSRGGPPAVYTDYFIRKNYNKRSNIYSYTFGCPGHLNDDGMTELKSYGCNTYNFINGYDLISSINKIMKRNGIDIYIKKVNPFVYITDVIVRTVIGLKNHMHISYTKTVKRLNKKNNIKLKAVDNWYNDKYMFNLK